MRATRKMLLGSFACVGVLAIVSNTQAIPTFPGETNILTGAPVAGTETYTNTSTTDGTPTLYLMPTNIASAVNSTPTAPTLGSAVGTTESIAPGGAGVGGINLGQPADITTANVPGDSRAGIPNVLTTAAGPAAYAGLPLWGERNMAVVQWQAIHDGVATALNPLGSVTGVLAGMTPMSVVSLSSPLLDNGSGPGSVAGDGIPDFIAWSPDPLHPGGLLAAYTVKFWDIPTALAAGYTLAQAEALTPKIVDYQGTTGLDISSPGGAYGNPTNPGVPTAPGDNDGDGRYLTETSIDPNTGLPIGPPSEVTDATDGSILLEGYLQNVTAEEIWRMDASGNVTLEIDFSANEVDYFGGSLLSSLVQSTPPAGLYGTLFPDGYSVGTLSATFVNIPWDNTTGTDPSGPFAGGLVPFEFAGAGSASANQSFNMSGIVPEPVSASLAGLGLGALGLLVSRRRRHA